MKFKYLLNLRLVILCLVLVSCTQKPDNREFVTKSFDFGPRHSDTEVAWGDNSAKKLSFLKSEASRNYFSTSERLMALGQTLDQPELSRIGRQYYFYFYDAFYSNKSSLNTVEFKKSPYIEFVIANTYDQVQEQTKDLGSFFAEQEQLLFTLIDEVHSSFFWPTTGQSLTSVLNSIELFLMYFTLRLDESSVDPSIKSALKKELLQGYLPKLQEAQKKSIELKEGLTLVESVNIIKSIISELDIELEKTTKEQLDSADDIGKILESDNPGVKALFKISLEFWTALEGNDEARRQYFPKDFYDYLVDKKPTQIECLKSPRCSNLILAFIQSNFIYPKYKEYGLDKLQEEMDSAASTFVIQEVGQVGAELVNELPQLFKEQLQKEFKREFALFLNIRNNYSPFLKAHAQKWYEDTFGRLRLYAMEPRSVLIDHQTNTVLPLEHDQSVMTSPSAVGSSTSSMVQMLRVYENRLESNIHMFRLMLMSRMNQLIAYGGFTDVNKENFKALSIGRPHSSKPLQHLNIQKTDNSRVFAFPDLVRVDEDLVTKHDEPFDVSVIEQAHLLNGLSSLVELFQDWRDTPYDSLLSQVTASDLLPEIPESLAELKVFPKAPLLAVSLANAGNVLHNLTRPGSPSFKHCVDNSFQWLDSGTNCSAPTALAGVVDISKGNRIKKVRAKPTAKYLLSVIRFLKATDDLERTQSEHLKKANNEGKTPIEQLKEARVELKKLVLGMSNLLSHRFQDKSGAIYNQVKLEGGERLDDQFSSLEAHLTVIQALLAASDYLGVTVYRSAAIDIYFHMNKNMWVKEANFYSSKPHLYNVTLAIETLLQLKPHLSKESRPHIDRFVDYWTKNL